MNAAEEEIVSLRAQLQEKDDQIAKLKLLIGTGKLSEDETCSPARTSVSGGDLTKEEVSRYSRQLLLPQVGAAGQKRLRDSSVLILGAGGLGCPSAIYLAAAGVGHLGIVDYDTVEASNLHRQIGHREAAVGAPKAASLAHAVRSLNALARVTVHDVQLGAGNAFDIVTAYDVVLDCSDNPATRYLVNDACVLSGRPLVSGSALRWEGQLTIYNYKGGPCYRCLYPSPPDPNFVTNCSDGGVMGAVPGLIGTLQALETIKLLLASVNQLIEDSPPFGPSFSGRLLVFDGECGQFRSVSLRPRRSDCAVCSGPDNRTIHRLDDVDYALFCGRGPNDKEQEVRLLGPEDRVSPTAFQDASRSSSTPSYLLIDVRPQLETDICRLPGSVNLPFRSLMEQSGADQFIDLVRKQLPEDAQSAQQGQLPVYVVCRRGNNSQLAVQRMRALLPAEWPVVVRDIAGGLKAWAEEVDPLFPVY